MEPLIPDPSEVTEAHCSLTWSRAVVTESLQLQCLDVLDDHRVGRSCVRESWYLSQIQFFRRVQVKWNVNMAKVNLHEIEKRA